MATKLTLNCDHCGSVYDVFPSVVKWNSLRGRTNKFCSRHCRVQYLSGERNVFWRGGIDSKARHAFIEKQRRHRVKASGGSHTYEQWEALKRLCNFTCLLCRRQEPEIVLTEDHIDPISKGGTNDISNIQPLCFQCNRYKWYEYVDFRPRAWLTVSLALKDELKRLG